MNDLPGRFANIRCSGCGLIRLSPRPKAEDLGMYYPDTTYYSYSQNLPIPEAGSDSFKEDVRRSVIEEFGYPVQAKSKLVRLFRPVINRIFKKQAAFGFGDRFPRYVPNGRALDVGCGSAVFLSILKRYGWSVQGIELKQTAADAAKAKHDIDVFVGHLIEARFDEGSFDLVSFNHSLEHLPDIVEVLTEVKRILKPGGVIYIEVPNAKSLSQRISGEYWLHWDTPRHLFSFAPETLRNLLTKVGFADVRTETFRADFYESDLKYKLEEKLGAKLPATAKLPLREKLQARLQGLVTDAAYLKDRDLGDFIACTARKAEL